MYAQLTNEVNKLLPQFSEQLDFQDCSVCLTETFLKWKISNCSVILTSFMHIQVDRDLLSLLTPNSETHDMLL